MAEQEKRPCVRCGYEADIIDKYCIKCGAPMLNGCTYKGDLFTKPCTKINSPEAAYCAGCGAKTQFYEAGLVQPYRIL